MITILTPYGRNEVTMAAIRLADLGVAAGIDVKLVALGVHEQGIHPYWDKHVVSGRDNGLYLAVRTASRCVWFVCDEEYHDMATLVSDKAKHILVPSWHHLTLDAKGFVAGGFDTIVCPTKLCHHLVRTHIFKDKVPDDKVLTWGRWDSGLTLTPHEGLSGSGGVKLLVACDTHCIDECGLMTLRIVNQLLEQVEHSRVTLMCTKTWSKRDRGRIQGLVAVWQGRLMVLYPTSMVEQTHVMQTHDWCLIPSVRADFGLVATRAHACGLPVITYDVAPFSELITNNYNGVLVPCELGANWMQAPVAAPSSVQFLTTAIAALTDKTKLFRLQSGDWRLSVNRKAFADLWLTIWGVGG